MIYIVYYLHVEQYRTVHATVFRYSIQSQYNEGLPMLVIGVTAIVASVLGMSLPETLNQPMPETLADLEQSPK